MTLRAAGQDDGDIGNRRVPAKQDRIVDALRLYDNRQPEAERINRSDDAKVRTSEQIDFGIALDGFERMRLARRRRFQFGLQQALFVIAAPVGLRRSCAARGVKPTEAAAHLLYSSFGGISIAFRVHACLRGPAQRGSRNRF